MSILNKIKQKLRSWIDTNKKEIAFIFTLIFYIFIFILILCIFASIFVFIAIMYIIFKIKASMYIIIETTEILIWVIWAIMRTET